MMKISMVIVACYSSVMIGCRHAEKPAEAGGTPIAPVELKLLDAPPLLPKCELMPLPDYAKTRRYLAYDLNQDGKTEYFIENSAGANSVEFALVDSSGNLLTWIGGDRLLVLATKSNGYFDLLDSRSDPWSIEGDIWEFNGGSYIKARSFEYDRTEKSHAFIENLPDKVVACWYADAWGRPSPES
jgi:hypothetical protein